MSTRLPNNEQLSFPEIGSVKLVRIKRKDIEIQVAADGSCTVRAPLESSTEEITSLVERRLTWIETKRAIASLNRRRPKEYVSGESFLLFGDEHCLNIDAHQGRKSLEFDGRKFQLKPESVEQARELFIKFYKEQAKTLLQEKVPALAGRLGYRPKSVRVLELGARWGSCSKSGGVNFNWKLAMLPPKIVDYLIIHELTHIDLPSHSAEFWRRVEAACPEYRKHEKWLEEHGSKTEL